MSKIWTLRVSQDTLDKLKKIKLSMELETKKQTTWNDVLESLINED